MGDFNPGFSFDFGPVGSSGAQAAWEFTGALRQCGGDLRGMRVPKWVGPASQRRPDGVIANLGMEPRQ